MAKKSLLDELDEFDKSSAAKDVPEAGAGHYLARGALSGISALADAVPNLYNLGKAAIGTVATAAGRPDLAPEVGEANPISDKTQRRRTRRRPASWTSIARRSSTRTLEPSTRLRTTASCVTMAGRYRRIKRLA